MSRTAINNFEIQNVPVPTQSKLLINRYESVQYPPFKPGEDSNVGGSLVLDFSKWWPHV